jgi:predicted small lipoprotein YifL
MADFMRFLPVWVALALAAAGCGLRGPLYLRDNPPPGVKPAKPPAVKPVPYPDSDTDEKK